jgi:predicted HTH domain antitoxin
MIVSVDVPDTIATQLHLNGEQGNRRALEMFALEGYRSGELSRGQVSELLGLEFNETEGFLKEHKACIPLTLEEFQRSSEALEEFLSR